MRIATLSPVLPRRLLVLLTTAALLFALVPGGAAADHTVVTDDDDLVTSIRWSGGTRYHTASKLAVEGSGATIATPANAAILATGEKFPDALAGSYLSGVVGAPILLTQQDSIPNPTLSRLTGDSETALDVETIYLLGGPVAISEGVEVQLEGLGFDVVRLAGDDRVATAATIATVTGDVGDVDGLATAIVATSQNYPDALVAGAAARAGTLPLLLTDPNGLSQPTIDALDELGIEQVLLAGGEVAVSAAVEQALSDLGYEVRRVAGDTRDHTAVEFARLNVSKLGFTTHAVGLARNDAFPDALAFAPFAGREGFSITLTAPDALPQVTADYLTEIASCRFDALYIPGGPVAVSDAVETAARRALTVTDCEGVDNEAPIADSARVVDFGTAAAGRSEPGAGDASVQVIFDEPVVCTDDVPQQFTFVEDAETEDATETDATSLRCNGSKNVLLGFPGGTLDDLEDAVITYVRAGNPDFRVYDLAGNEAENNQVVETFTVAAPAETLVVNTTDDAVDATPGDGVCETVVDGACSLRAAIMEANTDADLTRIEVPAGTYDLTITGRGEDGDATGDLDVTTDIDLVAIDDEGATIDANGIDRVLDVLGGVTFSLEGFTITGGNASGDDERGGGLRMSDLDEVTILKVAFDGNTASQAGGAIENTGGDVTIEDSTFTGNSTGTTPGNGGAVHAAGGSTAILASSASGNQAVEGGAFWIGGGGDMSVIDSTIDANVAIGGDAATAGARQGGGGLYNDGAVLYVSGSDITNNTAVEGAGSGGGLLTAGETGLLTVEDSTIVGNVADRAGGGIENDGSTALIGGLVEITGNTATGDNSAGNGGGIHAVGQTELTDVTLQGNDAVEGGGAWIGGGATMSLDGVSVLDNAAVDGGGLYDDAATLTLADTLVAGNVAEGDATSSGGGLTQEDGDVTITSSLFDDNDAPRAGGAIEVTGTGTATLSLENTDLIGNTAGPTPGNGGALHVTAADRVDVVDGLVAENVATAEGGGLWNNASATMVVVGTEFATNDAQGDAADQGGGALYNDGGRLALTDVHVGGDDYGIFDPLRLLAGPSSNVASGVAGSGGGLLSVGGDVTIDSTEDPLAMARGADARAELEARSGREIPSGVSAFVGNVANRAGGAIEVIGGTLDLDGVVLVGNSAGIDEAANPGNGGGIHVSGDATTSFLNSVAYLNLAAREGGALWNSATGVMTVATSLVLENFAAGPAADDGGGGIFDDGGDLTVSDSLIVANEALGDSGSGGGIHVRGTTLTVDGATDIAFNRASRAGGGIEAVDANATIGSPDEVWIDGNDAGANPGNGGGVHQSGGTVDLGTPGSFVRLDGNTAVEGGGAWVGGGGTMNVDNRIGLERISPQPHGPGYIADNIATGGDGGGANLRQGGGGLYNDGAILTVDHAQINDNLAVEDGGSGGGILTTNGGTTTVNETFIEYNRADRAGGGVENDGVGSTTTLTQSKIYHNVAEGLAGPGNGGGIHNSDGDVTVDGGYTGRNRAVEGGGYWTGGAGVFTAQTGPRTEVRATYNAALDEGGAFYNSGGTFVFIGMNAANGGHEVTDLQLAEREPDTTLFSQEAPDVVGNVYAEGDALSTTTATDSTFTDTSYAADGGQAEPTCETIVDPNAVPGPGGNTDDDGTCFGAGPGTMFVVNTPDDAVDADLTDGICETAVPGECSLRAAVMQANVDVAQQTITFSVPGVVLDIVGAGDGDAATGDLDITQPVVIDGMPAIWEPGRVVAIGTVDVDASALGDRIFDVAGATVELMGLNLRDGSATADATERGGAVRLDAGSDVTVRDSDVSNNEAAQAGGGIENSGGVLTVENTDFFGNDGGTTTGNGGALHAAGGTTTVTGGLVDDNVADEGGGFWIGGGGTLTVNGTTFTNNVASGAVDGDGGGALYNDNATLDVNGATIGTSGNGNHADGAGAVAGSGGGVLSDGGTLTIDDTTFTDNTANRAGGGLELGATAPAATATVTNTSFTNNEATGATSAGNGGAIHTTNQPITIAGGTVDGNTANEGGGFWNGTANMSVTGTSFFSNVADGPGAGDGGGALFNNGGTLDVLNATVGTAGQGNDATGAGGATGNASGGGLLTNGGTVTLSGVGFEANTAARAGGAIEIIGTAQVTSTDSAFTSNSAGIAPGNGGAVHQSGAGTSSSFTGGSAGTNAAASEGGAFWIGGSGSMTLTDLTATDNTAGNAGGTLYNDAGTLTLDGVSATAPNGSAPVGDIYGQDTPVATDATAGNNVFDSGNAAPDTCEVAIFVLGDGNNDDDGSCTDSVTSQEVDEEILGEDNATNQDDWSLTIVQPTTVTVSVDTASQGFDPMLSISTTTTANDSVARNDDSFDCAWQDGTEGFNFCPQITTLLQPGTYYVLVEEWDGFTTTPNGNLLGGTYTLFLSADVPTSGLGLVGDDTPDSYATGVGPAADTTAPRSTFKS